MIQGPLRLPAVATLSLALLLGGWSLWSSHAAGAKLAGVAGHEPLHVIIELRFAPEAFHLTGAQEVGQLVRTDGARLFVRSAQLPLLREFARAYWVRGVEAWNGK